MKAVVLNGTRKSERTSWPVDEILVSTLEQAGCRIEVFVLREEEIADCKGCFGCWTQSPGVCQVNDSGRAVARAIMHSDLAVFLTPVTFGGYSSDLKKAVDRLIPSIAPLLLRMEEADEPLFNEKSPRLLGVGLMEREDPEGERLFHSLVRRNAATFHSPAHAAGVVMPGKGEEEIRAQILDLLSRTEVNP
jgi:multimeric flavodoxin WrbA